ncbi:GTPase-activating protein gyp3 [Pseudocercospora fuligena]|uniref:GTPase-activating protein gyp3 n=1 Tax=Pseudocercospora fuligena TaxID=685502 RepID=A0A8H6RK24_9PEZI|nr:GTPase-activating protein gyp3 [Pseudocercospora fuligena]
MEVRSIHSADVTAKNSLDDRARRSLQLDRPSSMPKHGMSPLKRPNAAHRRSQSASVLMLGAPKTQQRGLSPSPSRGPPPPAKDAKPRTSVHIVTGKLADGRPAATPAPAADVPRDRYGFKKVSHHISLEQYDAWDRGYNEHIERRRKKWYAWMKQYGLSTEGAVRFPTKSEKAKRYVRKGIPPEFRGAAWFWYAGGPRLHAKHPTLYEELLVRVEEGELTDNDREHIERDLHRTFPDNVRFKPDPTSMNDAQAGAGGGEASEEAANSSPDSMKKRNRKTKEPEVPIIQKLRRVLQCFAVHNPQIGYCQSLNFIAGLLLLFLDENEAKTLILLNLVTSIHLPGTHGVALEGANIDIGVLMSFIRDTLPAIWNKLDDKKDSSAHGIAAAANVAGGIGGLRLPTVSLATTAWFMSLFVGTLPIESVLRVWDCLFFEGSKTLFRIALAIFKAGESQILKVSDPMEIFQVVQTIPRSMLDCNALLDVCFRRRGGFAGISQGEIEQRRAAKRRQVKDGIARGDGGVVRRLKTRLRTRTGGLV